VSGAVALYLEGHPYATPNAVSEYIKSSSAGTTVDALHSPDVGMLYVGTTAKTTTVARR
jgi:hypothetical protein